MGLSQSTTSLVYILDEIAWWVRHSAFARILSIIIIDDTNGCLCCVCCSSLFQNGMVRHWGRVTVCLLTTTGPSFLLRAQLIVVYKCIHNFFLQIWLTLPGGLMTLKVARSLKEQIQNFNIRRRISSLMMALSAVKETRRLLYIQWCCRCCTDDQRSKGHGRVEGVGDDDSWLWETTRSRRRKNEGNSGLVGSAVQLKEDRIFNLHIQIELYMSQSKVKSDNFKCSSW